MSQIGYVEHLEASTVNHEGIAELDSNTAGIFESGSADLRGDLRLQGVGKIHHHQATISEHVGVDTGKGDTPSAGQSAVRIEGERPLQEVVRRVAVEQGSDPRRFALEVGITNDDKAFILVGYIEEAIHQVC